MQQERIHAVLDRLGSHAARLEALLAELVLRGDIGVDELEVYAESTFARGYSHDVGAAGIVDYPGGKMLRLETHREGIYDQLPPGLFHRPRPRAADEGLENRVDTYRETRRQEREARNFFFPFEQESFRFAINSEVRERQLTDPFASPLRTRLLLEIWPACARLPASFYPLLGYILPLSYRIAGDLPLMQICFSALTQERCKVEWAQAKVAGTHQPGGTPTNEMGSTLGVDTVIHRTPEAELPELLVTFGPMQRDETDKFLADGAYGRLLEILSDCLVPLEVDVRYAFRYHAADDAMVLSGSDGRGSYLGFTTTIAQL